MLSCKTANNGLFLGTSNNISQCCMQGKGWIAPDWNSIEDLNTWYKSFGPFVEVRTDLDNGVQNSNCNRCWNLEKEKLKSFRVPSTNNDISVKAVEIRFSNKCNLQCKMCDVNSSDQIQNLVNDLQKQGIKNHFTLQHKHYQEFENKNKILQLVMNTDTIEYISFAGGEPFVMPEVEWFIDQLLKIGKTDLKLGFITNVTSLKTKVMDKLVKFKEVEFYCSIDGTEKFLEFQRYPAQWSSIQNNFDKLYRYKQQYPNISVIFSPCITQLNFLGIEKLFTWMSRYKGVDCTFNVLQNSSFLEYKLIPINHRQKIIDSVQYIDTDWISPVYKDSWRSFFDHGINLYRKITEREKLYLKDYVQVWNMKSPIKTKEVCPWIPELIT
jgi:organic radical activating enzyme